MQPPNSPISSTAVVARQSRFGSVTRSTRWFSRSNFLSIKARIFALVGMIVLALIGMGIHAAQSVSQARHEGRETEVRIVVETAMSILAQLHARAADAHMSAEQAKTEALDVLAAMRYREGDYVFVIDRNAIMLMHPIMPETVGVNHWDHVDPTGKAFFREMVEVSTSQGSGYVSYRWPRTADGEALDKITFVDTFEEWDLIVGSGVYVDDIIAEDQRTFFAEALFVSIAVLVLVGIAAIIARSIVNPISALTNRMSALTAGDIDSKVLGTAAHDEIGAMARAVEVFRENAIRIRQLDAETKAMAGDAEKRSLAMRDLQDQLRLVVDAALDGDFGATVVPEFAFDDLNALATSINLLMKTLSSSLHETTRVLEAIAQADLTQRVQGEAGGEFGRLRAFTNEAAINLAQMVAELRKTSSSVRNATVEIMAGAQDLADRTTRQAAALEESSASLEQLVHSVNDNAKLANSAKDIAYGVSEAMAASGETIVAANNAMDEITENSERISKIIGLIDDIAFQTNLLALNASVEAARAGEAGRGFAVVAVEVRRLAQSASKASSDVKALIDLSSTSVTRGAQLVSSAADGISRIVVSVQESATLVERIATANEEQALSITEISAAVRQMDEMTQHNAALVEQTSAAIEQTEAQAAKIDGLVSAFQIESAPSLTFAHKARG